MVACDCLRAALRSSDAQEKDSCEYDSRPPTQKSRDHISRKIHDLRAQNSWT